MSSNSENGGNFIKGRSVYNLAIKGGAWVLVTRIIQEILVVTRLAVMGRLLYPREMGILGIGLAVMAFMDLFTETGFSNALVQKKEVEHADLDAAWTVKLLRGMALFSIVYFSAPYVVMFFDGSGKFTEDHFLKYESFVSRLKQKEDSASEYVYSRLSPAAQQMLESTVGQSDGGLLRKTLVEDLNRIVRGGSIYGDGVFSDVKLSKYCLGLAAGAKNEKETIRGNRLILQEAFPAEIKAVVIDRELTTNVVRFLGVLFLLGAFSNIATIYFTRELAFGRQLILHGTDTFVNTAVAITVAVMYRSVWALALGVVASSGVSFVLGYLMMPYRPRLCLDMSRIKGLWNYGRHVFVNNILTYLIMEGDDVFVGKVLGLTSLGLYRYAYRFANMAATEVSDTISKVTFATYSRLQDNKEKLRAGYVKTLRVITLLCYPIGVGLIFLAHDFVRILLGDTWVGMVPAMQILCVFGLARCNQGGNVFNGLGRPDIVKKISYLRLAVMVIIIYPLTVRYGLAGTAAAVTVSALLTLPVMLYNVQRLIDHTIKQYLVLISLPAAGTAFMAAVLYFAKKLFAEVGVGEFVMLVLAGGVSYLCTVYLLGKIYKDSDIVTLARDVAGEMLRKS